MTTTDTTPLDRLEALAKAATLGPWRRDENSVWGACDPDNTTSYGMGFGILDCRSSAPKWARDALDYQKSEANAAFIAAANPATVLELLATIREQREALEFYADYPPVFPPSDGPWGVNSTDFGQRARAALTQRGE